jgi:hypothetical protein
MAIKTFTTGEVLTASDTNTYLANSGLVYVAQTTVGSAVTSVELVNAFNSTFDNYLISYSNINCSVNATGFMFRFGTVASPVTTNYKFSGFFVNYAGGTITLGQATPGNWEIAGTNTNKTNGTFSVNGPNLAAYTTGTSQFARTDASFNIQGIHEATTQHTSFHLYPLSGTITGGTVTVYGLRKG